MSPEKIFAKINSLLSPKMDGQYVVNDFLQSQFSVPFLSVAKDILLGAYMYAFYLSAPRKQLSRLIRYLLFIVGVRYVLSLLTTIQIDKQKHFQVSFHIAAFTVLAVLSFQNQLFGVRSNIVAMFLVFLYSMIVIIAKAHLTSEAGFTVVLTLSILPLFPGVAAFDKVDVQ